MPSYCNSWEGAQFSIHVSLIDELVTTLDVNYDITK